MKTIEPTKNEIFREMRCIGCCWLGGHDCECHRKVNWNSCFEETKKRWNSCFEETKKRLTVTELTDEEIMQGQAHNKAVWDEIYSMI